MIVRDIRIVTESGVTKVLGTIQWESRNQNPTEIFFAVDEEDAWRINANADSFRIPSAVAALKGGENRVTGEGAMCPALHDGLSSSLAWLNRWFEYGGPPAIDVSLGCTHAQPSGKGSAAVFVSGGVDSSAVLAANHTHYKPEHPLRISIGIVVAGIQPRRWIRPTLNDQLAAARADVNRIGSGMDIDIVPVATNLRALDMGGSFWVREYQGAALAGIGHLFSSTLSNLNIASSGEIKYLDELGSHPLLDPNYGNHSLRIWHGLAQVSRLRKTALLASYPELLLSLNVCNKAEANDDNCGRCEKCLRTMLALEALGVRGSSSFAGRSIRPRDLANIRILDRATHGDYAELVKPLNAIGRTDLAGIIKWRIRLGRVARKQPIRTVRVAVSHTKKRAKKFVRRVRE